MSRSVWEVIESRIRPERHNLQSPTLGPRMGKFQYADCWKKLGWFRVMVEDLPVVCGTWWFKGVKSFCFRYAGIWHGEAWLLLWLLLAMLDIRSSSHYHGGSHGFSGLGLGLPHTWPQTAARETDRSTVQPIHLVTGVLRTYYPGEAISR